MGPFLKKISFDDDVERAFFIALLSTLGLTIGSGLMLDDAEDFGQFRKPGHPSPLHHWQLGLALFMASLFGFAYLGPLLVKIMQERTREYRTGVTSSSFTGSVEQGSLDNEG